MRLGSFTTNEPPTATCERRPFGSNSHGWIAPGIDAGWRMVQPFLDAWRGAGPNGLALYEAGSEKPEEADQLLARDGRRWRPIA